MRSAVARAIAKLGGKTLAHKKIGVSFQTVHSWERQGYVRDIRWALRLATLSGIPLGEFAEERGANTG